MIMTGFFLNCWGNKFEEKLKINDLLNSTDDRTYSFNNIDLNSENDKGICDEENTTNSFKTANFKINIIPIRQTGKNQTFKIPLTIILTIKLIRHENLYRSNYPPKFTTILLAHIICITKRTFYCGEPRTLKYTHVQN